ncbi:MAG TPA: FkbM family methyltransferase [Byssovorax sp.]|jgi:FkbM family methyltransferase
MMDTEYLRTIFGRFVRKPWPEKRLALRNRFKEAFNHVVPGVDLPVRLSFGAWFLAGDDVCSDRIFAHRYEPEEAAFVGRYLQPGMTVLDIGAHHGFYTLLASHCVGAAGRVISFEPSSRERARLERHLRINRCTNVEVRPFALGSAEGEVELFRVDGRQTGFNSLRPPDIDQPTSVHRVPIKVLDEVLAQAGVTKVDFIKMDVEGAELEVLRGARRLLATRPRPVILAELSDLRAKPWGYRIHEVISLVADAGYTWKAVGRGGALVPAEFGEVVHANYVAWPPERDA